jgi:Trk K+ transport system NAD-binding subunit
MAGRTLRELALPRRFECAVVAVRTPSSDGGPLRRRPGLPETRLEAGDQLVVIGPAAGVAALARSAASITPA